MGRAKLVCIVVLMGFLKLHGDEPAKTTVMKFAKDMRDATLAGDCARLIDNTYPTAVEELGGRKNAIEVAEASMKEMKRKGFAIVKYDFSEPGDFYVEGDNTFVVLPATIEMKFPTGKILSKSYLLGISPDAGKSWKFIDGSGLQDKEANGKLLPKMPIKLKLPYYVKPEVIEDK